MTTQEILQELGIDYRLAGQHHHVRGGFIGVDCPWCNSHGSFRFGIPPYGWNGSCWSCGRRPLVHTLSEISGQSYHKVAKLFEDRDLGAAPEITQEVANRKLKLPVGVGPLLPAHEAYLKNMRGLIPKKIADLWGVRGIGVAPRYQWSLFIPIHYQDVCVSWTTRTIGDRHKRYDAAPATDEAMRAKDLLFGEDYVRNTILVCEGPMDVFRIGPGAVATLGLNYTAAQVARISKYPVRGICFDSESLAQSVAKRLCNDLSVYPGQTMNFRLITGKDPGECGREELKALKEFVRS